MSNPEFLQACNPSFSICLPKEANYYIDLTAARGENVVKRMRRAIALSSNKHTYQLLSGQIGSGKSTELLRLKFELEQQGFVVIYCAVDQYLQHSGLLKKYHKKEGNNTSLKGNILFSKQII